MRNRKVKLSSQEIHNLLRILLHDFCKLNANMREAIKNILKKIAACLKRIIAEEREAMDAFYRQFA